MSSFLELDPKINKALALCGYTQPTPIQAQAIPAILAGQDVVASSQTGSGKTAAFVLPALHYLSKQPSSKQTRILILTPTRELASQITKEAHNFGKFLNFNIISLVGGMPYGPQIRDLARGAEIIVATPGRLIDHIEAGRLKLSNVEMLILDEADRMLDMGFIEDIEHIAKLTPAKRQTLLFSATVDKKIMNVVRHLLRNPTRIDLSHEKIAPKQIKQSLYKVNSAQQKLHYLKHFLQTENIYKAIIFTATKIHADKLATQLRNEGYAAAALHGDLRQNVRNRTVQQLRVGKIQVLVATDVAARGIDINDVTHVFNFDLPRFCEDYIHRIGRTGRAGKEGTAFSFVMPTDHKHLMQIERYIGHRLQFKQIDEKQGAPTEGVTLKKHQFVEEEMHQPHRARNERSMHGKPRSRSEKFERHESRSRSHNEKWDRAPRANSRDENTDRPARFKSKNEKWDRAPGSRSRDEGADRPARFKSLNEKWDRAPKSRSQDERTERPSRFKSHDERRDRSSRSRDEGKDRKSFHSYDSFAPHKERGEKKRDGNSRFDHKTKRAARDGYAARKSQPTADASRGGSKKKKFTANKSRWSDRSA